MLWRSKKKTEQPSPPTSPAAGVGIEQISQVLEQEAHNTDTVPESDRFTTSARIASGLEEQRVRSFVIPSSYTISGTVMTSRSVIVQGEFSGGSITSPVAVVLEGGQVTAPLSVNSLRVLGTVSSKVTARLVVEVAADGRLEGEVESPAMRVEPGGNLCGALLRIGA